MSRGTQDRRRAFTLIELLVSIAIIGLLMAMVLPAIQRARESANRARCANNLSQIALGFLMYHEETGKLPQGGLLVPGQGWTSPWSGSPYGWAVQILPHVDQSPLAAYISSGGNLSSNQAIVSLYYCPSRRSPSLYGNLPQTDYAGNGGTIDQSYLTGNNCPLDAPTDLNGTPILNGLLKPTQCGNISYRPLAIRQKDIPDGASNTLLVGEKWVIGNLMEIGGQYWDSGYHAGFHPSVIRLGGQPQASRVPLPDYPKMTPPQTPVENFGSPHAGGFNAAMLDRSVRRIRYNNTNIMELLCDRQDGLLIDWTQVEP